MIKFSIKMLIFIFIRIVKNIGNPYNKFSLLIFCTLFWPIMSTGSLLKNWYGIEVFFALGLLICLTKFNFKNHVCDLNKKLKILTFLDFVKINFRKGFFLDNKKALFLIFNEYFSLELNK